jgi:serine/threonine protein kinase
LSPPCAQPENVLLKSDGSKPIGFVTKLSDFGLAKLLRDNYYIVNRSGSGTVTHLAPELFQVRMLLARKMCS